MQSKDKIKWLIVPAIIGGSALLADGIITPPISVSSAVEGIRTYYPEINTIPIVIGILFVLFSIQQFGTKLVGKFFAPMMLIWFSMLGILGLIQVAKYPEVFKALNPYYAYNLLSVHPDGFSCWALCFSVLLVQKHCIRTWAIGRKIFGSVGFS
jgi:KUP system potassium uptake protein